MINANNFFVLFPRQLVGFLLVIFLGIGGAKATDHWDGPAVTANTPADITDFFAVSMAQNKLLLIVNVNPGAKSNTPFLENVRYTVRLRPISRFTLDPIKALVSEQELRINCQVSANKSQSEKQSMDCELLNNGQSVLKKKVAVNTIDADENSLLRIYAGNKADQSFTDLGRVRMPVWRDEGFDDRPGVNSLAGKNVLSLVFVVDMQAFDHQYWALVSETYALHDHKTGNNEQRIDRMGRLEVTVFIVRNDELKDSWNREDTFKLDPNNISRYRKELQAGLSRLDDFEKRLDNKSSLDWPIPHPMIDLFLDDFLILNTQRHYRPSETGVTEQSPNNYNYLAIERALLLENKTEQMGGRLPNEDVIKSMMTLLINGKDRPVPNRGVGVHAPDKPATDEFPYLQDPTRHN